MRLGASVPSKVGKEGLRLQGTTPLLYVGTMQELPPFVLSQNRVMCNDCNACSFLGHSFLFCIGVDRALAMGKKHKPFRSHDSSVLFRLSRFSDAYRSRLLNGMVNLQHYCEKSWNVKLDLVLRRAKVADKVLSQFVLTRHEELGAKGLSLVKHAILGCQHVVPSLRNQLAVTWANVKVWEEKRQTKLRPPLPVAIWLLMVGLARAHGLVASSVQQKCEWGAFSCLLEVGLLCLLRPGELLRITTRDISLPENLSLSQGQAAIRIESPKNRRQFGNFQFVSLKNPSTIARLRDLVAAAGDRQSLWPGPPSRFSRLFKQITSELKLEDCKFTPGSLRPGGATFLFGEGTPINVLRFLGRWTAEKSLEHYIQHAMSTKILNQLNSDTTRRLNKLAFHCLCLVVHPSISFPAPCVRSGHKIGQAVTVAWCLQYAKLERKIWERAGEGWQS